MTGDLTLKVEEPSKLVRGWRASSSLRECRKPFMQPGQITRGESTSWDPGHRGTVPIGLTAEIITVRDTLESYAGEWNALLEQSAARTVFLTWEWISAWLEAVCPDAELLVVFVRDREGRLAAIAPFYRSQMRFLRLVSYRCLRVLGDLDSGAEYPDIIVRRGCEGNAIPVLREALLDQHHAWDCLWLPALAGWTGAMPRLHDLCAGGMFYLHERRRDFSSMDLPDTHDAYLKSLSANARSNIKRHTKRLWASHQVEFVRCESEDELPAMLSHLYDLHHRRWSSTGEVGSFIRRPAMVTFYDRFASMALALGWLRLYALKVDGAIRALQYGYASDGCFYQMQEGFDPAESKGIGNVLRNLVIKACIEEGLQQYDFLGGFTEHKRRWGAKQRFGHDLFIGRRSLKTRALFTKEVWPTGRYIRQ